MNTQNAFEYFTKQKTFDTEKAVSLSYKAAAEGIVLLENKRKALPLKKDEKVAFFGRMQKHYCLLGTGSGGRVCPPFITNIFDSLKENGVLLDKTVEEFYDSFVEQNPYDEQGGWSHPSFQKEAILKDNEALVASAASENETALYVITRTAGEDKDLPAGKGGYLLTDTEKENLALLRRYFKKLVVLLNTVGVIDVSDILPLSPDALLMLWAGGMMGGKAAADVLTGIVSPCGRLPDTMAKSRESYPACENFGTPKRVIYKEDIYVGYRYFETFAENDVVYPFGYGLSYTEFGIYFVSMSRKCGVTTVKGIVRNLGDVPAKAVVQCYVQAPQGNLGKPKKVLAAFEKTKVLQKDETYDFELNIADERLASFDDKNCAYLLEKGEYIFSLGENVRDSADCCSFTLDEDLILKKVSSALAPKVSFDRLVNKNGEKTFEQAPLYKKSEEIIPEEIPVHEKDGMLFSDVADGKATLEDFVARLSDEDLKNLVRAEGMSSPKVTPGTAAAFVGVTPSLAALGVPTLCCTDGPSGIRMVSDAKCVAYPSATCLASTFDPFGLVRDCYFACGCELASWCVDILLGPGANIHRDPLCGRNFEYFSEDPLLSGLMASGVCLGLDDAGVSGALKHFMANNQECDRHHVEAVISERAIREIYAKPFEICVKTSPVRSVMTSYNPINNYWAASNYDLTVKLLRNDFGFDGFVMTDWWANVNSSEKIEKDDGCKTKLSGMVHALGDVYMVTPDAARADDDILKSLADGTLKRSELQKCALDLLSFALDSLSYKVLRSGILKRDLRAECAEKVPFAVISGLKDVISVSSDKAERVILRAGFTSSTDTLTQSNVSLNINEKRAADFIVGGTDGKTFFDCREISLVEGENKFVFTPETKKVELVSIELFK